MFKMKKILILLTMLGLSAEAASDEQAPQIVMDEKGNVEVIEVQGMRPLYQYRNFRDAKRSAFMNYFNEIVSEPDFKFRCKRVAKYASKMKKEVCKNEFQWRIEDEIKLYEARQGNLIGAYAVSQLGTNEAKALREALVQEIQGLLEADPDLKNKYVEFKVADLTYQKMHQAKFGALSGYDAEQD
jgi:hypothetical protein